MKTPLGRKRHLPEAKYQGREKRMIALKMAAYRKAVNSQIQGFASDIIAVAMRNIRREFMKRDWWLRKAMLQLQVHDELHLEVDADIAEEAFKLMQHLMEHAIKLRVPVLAEGSVGDNWRDAK